MDWYAIAGFVLFATFGYLWGLYDRKSGALTLTERHELYAYRDQEARREDALERYNEQCE